MGFGRRTGWFQDSLCFIGTPHVFKESRFHLIFNQGGLSFYGGVLGGFACGFIYAKRKALPVWPLDLAAPWIALGYSIVELAAF